MERRFWHNYSNIVVLLTGILIGCLLGLVFGTKILFLQAVGDIFLNLLFTVVVPLVFFAIASAIAQIKPSMQIGRLVRATAAVMIGTVLVSAVVTALAIWCWPMHPPALTDAKTAIDTTHQTPGQVLTQLLTVPEFFALFTRKSMLALIVFSVGVGVAALKAGEKGQAFAAFLVSGNEVMQRLLSLLMYGAPVGLGAYFACQVAGWGGNVLGAYGQAIGLLSGVSIFYYFVFFSIYAFIAGGAKALRRYWKYNITPSATAFGTGSSIATIPANLEAAAKMGIPGFINDLVIPLGGPLHKEGSAIASMVKVYLLFALFHPPITPVYAFVLAVGLAWVVSIVEGGIPNGGYIAEVLTISVMGLPPEALPPIILVGTITDPISTVVNATGDTATAMLIARITRGARWTGQAPEIGDV